MLLTHSGLLDDTEQATVHKKRMGLHCGAYVTRTRDPLRDRQVF